MQTIAPKPAPPRWKRLILRGVLFELLLLALCYCLPETGSALAVGVREFAWLVQPPPLLLFFFWPFPLCLFVICGVFAMGLFWAWLFHHAGRLWTWLTVRLGVSKRQKILLRVGLGVAGALLLARVILEAWPQKPIPFTANPDVTSVVGGNTAFALDLYQRLREQPGNLFFSPYSISMELAMTCVGARNQPEREMAGTLHFSLPATNLHTAFGVLTTRINQIQRWRRLTLTTANSLWGQQDYPFAPPFLDLIRTDYAGEAHQVDFQHSTPVADRQINEWVKSKTRGKITGDFGSGRLTPETRLVLCSAIYFQGRWQNPFNASATQPKDFNPGANQTVTVPMMRQESEFKMICNEDQTVKILELPYVGTNLSMVLLVPSTKAGLEEIAHHEAEAEEEQSHSPGTKAAIAPISLGNLENELTPGHLRAWLQQLDNSRPHTTKVELPRFTVSARFDLAGVLATTGMASAFQANADFSGMDTATNPFISDVLHQTFVEVNETGTEAAAVTMLRAKRKGIFPSFIADHPFLFLIRENGSGSILFLGRMVDPSR